MGALDHPDIELSNQGHLLMQNGDQQKGLELIKQAAFNGQPNAISTYNWHLILKGQFEEAISITEKLVPVAIAWIEKEAQRLNKSWGINKQEVTLYINSYLYQIYNMQSNAAVAYLATGKVKDAMEMWEEAAEKCNHLEARFYPIFHDGQKSPELMLRLLTKEFTKEELQNLVSTMVDVSTGGKGWFADWAKAGLNILQQAAKKTKYANNAGPISNVAASSAATFGAGYVASKAAREYIQDQSLDSVESGEGAFDWLGDFFN
jgi:tetratricopeptide (TPR) repeat protein